MPVEFHTGTDFSGGGKYIDQEGWYHFIVFDAVEHPVRHSGELIDGMLFGVECTVCAGTVEGAVDKVQTFNVRAPSPSHKDGGAFCQKVADRVLIALGVIGGAESDKGKAVAFEVADLKGRQFIAQIEMSEAKSGKHYPELKGAEIYHVDDPVVAGQPKNEQMLALIPASLRRIGSRPAAKPAPPKPAPVAAMSVDNLDI